MKLRYLAAVALVFVAALFIIDATRGMKWDPLICQTACVNPSSNYTTEGLYITSTPIDPFLTMDPADKVSIQATPFFNIEFIPEKGELVLRQKGHKACVFKAYDRRKE